MKLQGLDAAGQAGPESYIIFVVRAAAGTPTRFLLQLSTFTWQLYNRWGGASGYTGAGLVSFKRPYQAADSATQAGGNGAGLFLTQYWDQHSMGWGTSGLANGCFGGWEYNMVRWLEREGYDVAYCANEDLVDPRTLDRVQCLLSVGHDEYWTTDMFDAVTGTIKGGMSAAFLSGNTMYCRILYDAATRHLEGKALMYGDAINTAPRTFTSGEPYRDTRLLIGATFWKATTVGPGAGVYARDLELRLSPNLGATWLLDGTSLAAGQSLGVLGGHEVNAQGPAELPPHFTPLIEYQNPNPAWGSTGRLPPWRDGQPDQPTTLLSGGFAERGAPALAGPGAGAIFAAGSCMWSWALDDFMVPSGPAAAMGRTGYVSGGVQQLTRNALRRLGAAGSRLFSLASVEAAPRTPSSAPGPFDTGSGAWSLATTPIPGHFSDPARAEVLLYDAPRGIAQLHRWDASLGLVSVGAPRTGWRTTWQIIPIEVAEGGRTHFLCYDAATGEAQVYRWDAGGEVPVGPFVRGLSRSLEFVAGCFLDRSGSQLLAYDRADGVGVMYRFDAASAAGLVPVGPPRRDWRRTWRVVPIRRPAPAVDCLLFYDPLVGEAQVYGWQPGGEQAIGALFSGWRRTWNLIAAADGAILFHDTTTGQLFCFRFSIDGATLAMQNGWGGTAGPATRNGAVLVCHQTQIVPVDFTSGREFLFYLPATPLP